MSTVSQLPQLIEQHRQELLDAWIVEQLKSASQQRGRLSEFDLRQQATEFLQEMSGALTASKSLDIAGPEWARTRVLLESISKSRARQDFSPAETTSFILALKRPVFDLLQRVYADDPGSLSEEIWNATLLLDKLGMHTAEAFIAGREEIIKRQQNELMELSTPVVKIWEKVLALPLIGTLDSARTQVVMESLLQEIVNTESSVAIIDITGVMTVDTLVAQHLMKTVAAAKLMGAECIISGIRPQIAQSMVHLGISFTDITTKATLADAIRHAFLLTGVKVSRVTEL